MGRLSRPGKGGKATPANDALLTTRKETGKTQAMVAREAGISQNHWAQIESGVRRPSIEVALRIASILNRPVEELFGSILQEDAPHGGSVVNE